MTQHTTPHLDVHECEDFDVHDFSESVHSLLEKYFASLSPCNMYECEIEFNEKYLSWSFSIT